MGTNGSTMLKPLRQGPPPTDPARVSSSASCSLAARHEAVRGARRFTRSTLTDWELDERFDDIALVVSELVTNALRHALPAEPPLDYQDPPIRLHLMCWPGRLVCAVRDPSPSSPGSFFAALAGEDARAFPDPGRGTAESGRGLLLVDSFSDNWGWYPLAGALHGKVVWALFRLG
ncbi:ATP-binding protein [Streptomyces sp. NPDC057638]|uniref:ATP-binding protein n=1 Tax=Streptomyces sp. NPDC057638 TaxID=3346190 RepID=UPI0036CF4ACC